MKNVTKLAIALLFIAGSQLQAGSGKTFGAVFGGTFLGNTLSNAMSRPNRTVVVKENSDMQVTNRAVKSLNQDMEDLYNEINKLRKAMREVAEKVADLAHEVKMLKKEKGSKKSSGKSWFDEL